jgi:uncharacterized protein (TIGR02300 family)
MGRPLKARGRGKTVTKAELGTKRVCPNCGARYYDLNRNPILCPRCGTQFELAAVTARARSAPVKPEVAVPVEDDADTEKEVIETVSLEEADDEVAETGAVVADDDDEEEIEAAEDDTFLADDDDDDDDDVEDIVGDVDEEDT